MLEQHTTTIDGHEVAFTPLMAPAARDHLIKLIKKLGPSIAAFSEGLENMTGLESITMDTDDTEILKAFSKSFSGSILSFSEAITPQYYVELVDVFFKNVQMTNDDGNLIPMKKEVRNLFFSTRLFLEARILFWCLGVQYEDFFAPLRGTLGSFAVRLAQKSPSSSNSHPDSKRTGFSGESQPQSVSTAD